MKNMEHAIGLILRNQAFIMEILAASNTISTENAKECMTRSRLTRDYVTKHLDEA